MDQSVSSDADFAHKQAEDRVLTLPAVGAEGVPSGQELQPFHSALDPSMTHFDAVPVANVPCERSN